jgi:hypothetical protein
MKTKQEIEQLAEEWFLNDKSLAYGEEFGFIQGYNQCQEDMADYIFQVAFQFHRLGKYYGNKSDTHFTDIYEETINSLNKQD